MRRPLTTRPGIASPVLASLLLVQAMPSDAASSRTNGTMGETSTASIRIVLKLMTRFQVRQNSLAFSTPMNGSLVNAESPNSFCLEGNLSAARFSMVLVGSGESPIALTNDAPSGSSAKCMRRVEAHGADSQYSAVPRQNVPSAGRRITLLISPD